jgi:uncharacterized protein YggU (UPF0235/DUF167 family)
MGMSAGLLRAQVTAPPVEGRANKALCQLIAKRIGVAPSKVTVAKGAKSLNKIVRVDGVDRASLEQAMRDPDR